MGGTVTSTSVQNSAPVSWPRQSCLVKYTRPLGSRRSNPRPRRARILIPPMNHRGALPPVDLEALYGRLFAQLEGHWSGSRPASDRCSLTRNDLRAELVLRSRP